MTYLFSKKFTADEIVDLKGIMSVYSKPKWITISPDPKDNPVKGDKFIEKWRDVFFKWYKAIKHGVFVLEVAHERFHWHILIDVKDVYKFGILWRGLINHNRCQTKIYEGLPKGGVEYLFKDIEVTREHVKIYDVIADFTQMDSTYKHKLANDALIRIAQNRALTEVERNLDPYKNKPIPNCFLEDSDTDDD